MARKPMSAETKRKISEALKKRYASHPKGKKGKITKGKGSTSSTAPSKGRLKRKPRAKRKVLTPAQKADRARLSVRKGIAQRKSRSPIAFAKANRPKRRADGKNTK